MTDEHTEALKSMRTGLPSAEAQARHEEYLKKYYEHQEWLRERDYRNDERREREVVAQERIASALTRIALDMEARR